MAAWHVSAAIALSAVTAAGQGQFGWSGSIVFEQPPIEGHIIEIDSGGGIIRAADVFVLLKEERNIREVRAIRG